MALLAIVALFAAPVALAQSPPAPPPVQGTVPEPPLSRGRLLYETHCIACHSSQIHWRDGRIVRDWPGLVEQVTRWQERAKLQWSDADTLEVARHLNTAIYRLPTPGPA